MTNDQETFHGKQVLIIGVVATSFLVLGVMIGWYFGKNFVQSDNIVPVVKGLSDEEGEKEARENETRTFTGVVKDVGDDSLSVAIPELNTDKGTPIVDFFVAEGIKITATFQEQNEELSRVIETEDGGIAPPPSEEDLFTYRELTLTLSDLKTQDLIEISAISDGEKLAATSIMWLGAVLNEPKLGEVVEISTENRFEPNSAIVTPPPPPDNLPPLPPLN